MNNPIGYGVFGTFGDPYGYQQVFYYGVDFKDNLDLDDEAITLFQGAELYTIKRTLIEEKYTVCLCKYTFVEVLNSERQSTFIGSCIVLQNSFADADDIYKVLCEMHENLTSNDSNFEGIRLRVAQAEDVYIREPADFVALKANVIPISKTPFSSTEVATERQYFVLPDAYNTSSKDAQITTFFDEGLKYYGETGTLYFSFDKDVIDYVAVKGYIETMPWDRFSEQKYAKQSTIVVRTKKGIQKISSADEPVDLGYNNGYATPTYEPETVAESAGSYVPPTQYQPYPSSLIDDEDEEDEEVPTYEDDTKKPFDLWEDPVPAGGWPAEKVREKVNEYNRLFRYTNTLLDYINEPANKKKNRKKITERRDTEHTYTSTKPKPTLQKKGKRRGVVLILLFVLILGSITVYYMAEENYETPPVMTAIDPMSHVSMDNPIIEDNDTISVVAPENVATEKQQTQTPNTPEEVISGPLQKPHPSITATTTSTKPKATGVDSNTVEEVTITKPEITKGNAPYMKADELHPKPNMELPSTDIAAFNQTDVKNKSLTSLVKLLYDNVPSNIGNVYKGQETEYAAALLNGNRQAFQKAGSDYICTTDNATTLRVPAYKSPRLPVVYPK